MNFIKILKMLNPKLSVDCVIFGLEDNQLKILLIKRLLETEQSESFDLKLPGSPVQENENLQISAEKVLQKLTGLKNIFLQQFHTFGTPNRISEQKDILWMSKTYDIDVKRIISVAFYALVNIDDSNRIAHTFEGKAKWYALQDVSELAMDHNQILAKALVTLQKQLKTEPIGFELLPVKFSLRQVQNLYEVILGRTLDNRNFRKKISKAKYLIPLDEKQKGVAHKPAQLYKFDKKIYEKNKMESYGFIL